jgi:hypothetical protein
MDQRLTGLTAQQRVTIASVDRMGNKRGFLLKGHSVAYDVTAQNPLPDLPLQRGTSARVVRPPGETGSMPAQLQDRVLIGFVCFLGFVVVAYFLGLLVLAWWR